jgi:hypothetical protein
MTVVSAAFSLFDSPNLSLPSSCPFYKAQLLSIRQLWGWEIGAHVFLSISAIRLSVQQELTP